MRGGCDHLWLAASGRLVRVTGLAFTCFATTGDGCKFMLSKFLTKPLSRQKLSLAQISISITCIILCCCCIRLHYTSFEPVNCDNFVLYWLSNYFETFCPCFTEVCHGSPSYQIHPRQSPDS